MRIALASWESLYSVSVGGVAVHVSKLASALARRRHDVHVFTRGAVGQAPTERIGGVVYHRCSFDVGSSFVDSIEQMCQRFVDRYIEVARIGPPFDIFHAHDWLASESMVEVQETLGAGAVLTIHSTEYGRCGNRIHEGDSRRIREIEVRGIETADRVITVSKMLRREVEWLYGASGEDIDVIYNGIDARSYDLASDPAAVKRKLGIDPDHPIVLFVGRLTSQKGPDLLLSSAPKILRSCPDAQFVFAGLGDMEGSLRRDARKLGVEQSCVFLGGVWGEALTELYRSAEMVVVPSRNEPFGIIILEAWSCEKPVVSTLNGGPAEFVLHETTGLKVYPQPESISEGVVALLEDRSWAAWMGRNGRLAAETAFSWDAIAARTEKVYQEAMILQPVAGGEPWGARAEEAGQSPLPLTA